MRIGVFGGSFDPPHVGHLLVAQDATEALELDLLLWVPARQSPFKQDREGTDPDLRAQMVETAVQGHPRFRVWRGELTRTGPSYTVDTLRALHEEYPEAELVLLMGWDQWCTFPRWRAHDEILRLATVGVLRRPGSGIDDPGPKLPHRVVPVRRVDLSSTEIRDRARRGDSLRYLVPEAVRRLVTDHELYSTETGTAPVGTRTLQESR